MVILNGMAYKSAVSVYAGTDATTPTNNVMCNGGSPTTVWASLNCSVPDATVVWVVKDEAGTIGISNVWIFDLDDIAAASTVTFSNTLLLGEWPPTGTKITSANTDTSIKIGPNFDPSSWIHIQTASPAANVFVWFIGTDGGEFVDLTVKAGPAPGALCELYDSVGYLYDSSESYSSQCTVSAQEWTIETTG